MTLLIFFNISGGEIIFVLLVALLLFGAKGFPNIARQLGRGLQQVRRASGELQKDIRDSTEQVRGTADQVRDELNQVDPRKGRSSEDKDTQRENRSKDEGDL